MRFEVLTMSVPTNLGVNEILYASSSVSYRALLLMLHQKQIKTMLAVTMTAVAFIKKKKQ